MLSGRSPFHSPSRDTSSAAIMKRITAGDFNLSSPQWDVVSKEAKEIVQGLLTVNPLDRLTMSELRCHPWLQHANRKNLRTPLATPEVLHGDLCMPPTVKETEGNFRATFDAFHLATRGGFRLAEVNSASLAQRRMLKKSSDSLSTSTSSSSCASSRNSNPSSATRHISSSSSGVPLSSSSASSAAPSVFTFPDTKVSAYLETLSPSHSPKSRRREPESIQSPGSNSNSSNSLIRAEFTVIQVEPLKFKFELCNNNNNNNNNGGSHSSGSGSSRCSPQSSLRDFAAEPLEGLAVAAATTAASTKEHSMITRGRKRQAKGDATMVQKRLRVA